MAAANISTITNQKAGLGWRAKAVASLLAASALAGAGHFSVGTALADAPHQAANSASHQLVVTGTVGNWPTLRNSLHVNGNGGVDSVGFNTQAQPNNFDRGYISPN